MDQPWPGVNQGEVILRGWGAIQCSDEVIYHMVICSPEEWKVFAFPINHSKKFVNILGQIDSLHLAHKGP